MTSGRDSKLDDPARSGATLRRRRGIAIPRQLQACRSADTFVHSKPKFLPEPNHSAQARRIQSSLASYPARRKRTEYSRRGATWQVEFFISYLEIRRRVGLRCRFAALGLHPACAAHEKRLSPNI